MLKAIRKLAERNRLGYNHLPLPREDQTAVRVLLLVQSKSC